MPVSERADGLCCMCMCCGQHLVFNSELVEQKSTACEVIFQIVSSLRQDYYPYALETVKVSTLDRFRLCGSCLIAACPLVWCVCTGLDTASDAAV